MLATFCAAFPLVLAGQSSLSLRPTGTMGSIEGTVRDDMGKIVGGAAVAAVRIFPITNATGPRLVTTYSDAQGSFRLDGLLPASYKICAATPGLPLLDPCLWSRNPPTWNLLGGQTGHVELVLASGSWINVRVNDPKQHAAASQAKGAPAFDLGVFALSGTYLRFDEISTDATGSNFRIAVPRGTNVHFVFSPGSLTVQNAAGKLLTGSAGPSNLSVGQTDQTIEFTVQ